MPKIGSLLDEQTMERLKTVVLADLEPEAPAKTVKVDEDFTYVVKKASTDPNPPKRPRPLTASDAIDIDPRGEAMMDAKCVDCGVPLLINPQLPEGADPELPRIPICDKDAKVRARFAAMDAQRVEIMRRKHARITTTTKENDMPKTDLNGLSDAALGALVRQQMQAAAAAQITTARPEVESQRREAEMAHDLGIAAEQERRVDHCLPGFPVGTSHEVPALDLSQVSSLDEAPSGMERSPYNKARFRLAKEGPLDPETTTYGFLAEEHERLRSLAARATLEQKVKPAKKVKETVVLAVNDADEKAVLKRKAKALAEVMGVSTKKAKAIILASA